MNMMNKKQWLIILLMLMMGYNTVYAAKILDKEPSDMTVGEAISYSDDGNFSDVFTDYEAQIKRQLPSEYFLGYELNDEEKENNEKFSEKMSKVYDEIEKNIESNTLSIENEHRKIFLENLIKYLAKNKIKVVISIVLLVILVLVSIFRKEATKRLMFAKCCTILIYLALIFMFIVYKFIEQNAYSIYLVKYLNGDYSKWSDEHIVDNKTESINMLDNVQWNISHLINDYILKVYRCVRSKATGEELKTVKIKKKSSHDHLHFVDNEYYVEYDGALYLNADEEKVNVLNGNSEISDGWQVGVRVGFVDVDGICTIYENITEEDIKDFNDGVFLKKLVNKLDQVIKSRANIEFKDENLLDYITRIHNYNELIAMNPVYRDAIFRVIKYWYIDGDDREIELPYGLKISYEKARYERRNIKEFYRTNVFDIINNSSETDQKLIVFYIDDVNLKHGDYVNCEYKTQEIFFNSMNVTHKINRAQCGITSEEKMNWNKKEERRKAKADALKAYIETDWSEGGTKSELGDESLERQLIVASFKPRQYDWKDFPFSEKFINKYKDKRFGIFDFMIVQYPSLYVDNKLREKDKNKELMQCVRGMDDDETFFCLFKIIWNDNNEVDDILTYRIPEEKADLTYEEMWNLAFND